MSDVGRVGAAKRRRDRQLRAFHRHEQLTVRMELATALHHSALRPRSRVVEGPSEGVELEKYVGPRAQKRPLPGMRPGLPREPEPQVRAATVGHVAAGDGLPTLAMPSLAGAAGEVVDAGEGEGGGGEAGGRVGRADDLKCTSRDPALLLRAARFTTGYVRLVGQEPAPGKCVLLSTSRVVRSDMKDWVLSKEGD